MLISIKKNLFFKFRMTESSTKSYLIKNHFFYHCDPKYVPVKNTENKKKLLNTNFMYYYNIIVTNLVYPSPFNHENLGKTF
jgi:hypothetical protein